MAAGPKTHPDTLRGINHVLVLDYSVTEAAKIVGVHRTTLSRAISRYLKKLIGIKEVRKRKKKLDRM